MAVLYKGKVKYEGSPTDALKLLENKVYEKQVSKQEIQEIKNNYRILSHKLKYGFDFVSIYSEQDPGNGFTIKQPDLEDVFFYLCNE
jgi:ABC-type multidrug transport system ATPase subunit